MKKVLILGPGCPKCIELFERTGEAIAEANVECELKKITDIQEITSYGVMMTPALIIDDIIMVSGKAPSKDEIVAFLKQ